MLQLDKRLVKRWRVTAAFLTVILLGMLANDQCLRWVARQNPSSRVNWLFQTTDQDHDLVILGSSLLKEGISPALLTSQTNRKVTQLSWGGRGLSEQSLYLNLFLQQHRCKTLLLELPPHGLKEGAFQHPLDEFRYIPRLANPTIRKHLRKHCGNAQTLAWRYAPMWAMAQFSSQIGWHDLMAMRHRQQFDPNLAPDEQKTAAPDVMRRAILEDQKWLNTPESPENFTHFQDILALCEKYHIEVMAVYPPTFEGVNSVASRQPLARYRELLSGTPILVTGTAYAHLPQYFQDAHHLNSSGSKILTQEIAAFMASHSSTTQSAEIQSAETQSAEIQ